MATKKQKPVLGWREWMALPDLGVDEIKVKVDTGARTSALHAEDIRIVKRGSKSRVYFTIYPVQKSKKIKIEAHGELIEKRVVRSSLGLATKRPVILTDIQIGEFIWPIELTLINRDIMGFRMLLGRQAIRHRALVDPGESFLVGLRRRRRKGGVQ